MKDLDQVKQLKKQRVDEKKFNFLIYRWRITVILWTIKLLNKLKLLNLLTGEKYKLIKRKFRSYYCFYGRKTYFNRTS